MDEEIEYIIDPVSPSQYEVMKFLYGTLKKTYEVTYKDDKPKCSCPAGIYRGYCKHKDWVHQLKAKETLPTNVAVREQITKEGMQELLTNL